MESFPEFGWPAFAALGGGSLATLLGVVALALALIKPRTGLLLGIVALAASLGAPGVGFAGMLWARQRVDAILTSGVVDPEQTDRLRTEGYREAGQCISVGTTIGILPIVMAAIAIGIGAARKSKETSA